MAEHAARDVLDVDRPLPHVRVLERAEGLGGGSGGRLPRARRAGAVADRGGRGREQRVVVEQQRVRVEDLGLVRGPAAGDGVPRRLEVAPHGRARRVQALALLVN